MTEGEGLAWKLESMEEAMPSMCRWWLNRQLAHTARADALARIDVAIVLFGVTLALLLR